MDRTNFTARDNDTIRGPVTGREKIEDKGQVWYEAPRSEGKVRGLPRHRWRLVEYRPLLES
jgi:hypothetical protein